MEVKGKLKIFPDRPDQDRRVRSRHRLRAQCPQCVDQGVAAPSLVRPEVWCEGLCWKHACSKGLKPPSRAGKNQKPQKKSKKSAQQANTKKDSRDKKAATLIDLPIAENEKDTETRNLDHWARNR